MFYQLAQAYAKHAWHLMKQLFLRFEPIQYTQEESITSEMKWVFLVSISSKTVKPMHPSPSFLVF